MKGFWPTVKLLMHYARVRAQGRSEHQKKLLHQRNSGKASIDWGCLAPVILFVIFCGIHGMFAWMHGSMVDAAWRVEAGRQNRLLVDDYRWEQLRESVATSNELRITISTLEAKAANLSGRIEISPPDISSRLQSDLAEVTKQFTKAKESLSREERNMVSRVERASHDLVRRSREWSKVEQQYREHWDQHGLAGFTSIKELKKEGGSHSVVPLVGTFILFWWFIMQAFQGEGLEMDFQRRRHPMWEWLLSHPVKPAAVFAAEMLSPLAANPMFLAAPCFWIALFIRDYGAGPGLLAGLIAGVPMAMAACFVSKSIEVATMLRLSPRNRGGVLGIMSWIGYASLFAGLILVKTPALANALARGFDFISQYLPIPVMIGDWMLGKGWGPAAAWKGAFVSAGLGFSLGAAAIAFTAWATKKGIGGGFASVAAAPSALGVEASKRWLKDPLYRKELLWFWRDKSAVIQVFLIPLTMAGHQAFNLRGVGELMTYSWHVISGFAVIFGTYFLFIIGPRSLISEGPALWIPMGWPRGIEGLLKAKARLWWMLSSGIVILGLAVAALVFPADAWKIGIVAVGWLLFSGSLAEKTVTLVSAPSSSGEPEPIPSSRRMAASLGTFTFSVGVLSQQWSLALVGVVYSWLTSAAMWQNFRARMPYLIDPWSEKLPPAPTLMHAMIAVSAMVEVTSIPLAVVIGFAGQEHLMFARALCYGIVGAFTAVFTDHWLAGRGVHRRDLLRWGDRYPGEPITTAVIPQDSGLPIARVLSLSVGSGVLLGLMGWAYSSVIIQFPEVSKDFAEGLAHLARHPNERWWMLVMAVVFAPLAEEYLFRGLLFRALDREWGGWKAIGASAAFFAIYHSPAAWVPVFAVGFFNAWLFKASRRLWPCVIVHATYNAIIVMTM